MNRCLEIGPGDGRLLGQWVTVDSVAREGVVDYVCQWGTEPLPFPDESFELVYAAHVLEHIPWYQTVDALREAARVLAPGGRIELHVPDFDVLMHAAQSKACLDDFAEAGINGRLYWMHWVAERLFHLGPEAQWHRACFNAEHLAWCLNEAGFEKIDRISDERGSDHGIINLGMAAAKPIHKPNGSVVPRGEPAKVLQVGSRGEVPSGVVMRVDARLLSRDQMPVPGAEDLPYCHSRREYDAQSKVYFCAHPNVHLPGQLATADVCRRCSRWQEPPPDEFRLYANHAGVVRNGPCWYLGEKIGLRDCASCRGQVHVKVFDCRHEAHDSTTIHDCSRCPDYEQRLDIGKLRTWAVGVTTAPRRAPTLGRTLASLRRAGWSSVRLFAEPGSQLPDASSESDVSVTLRESTLGAWPNWYLALAELYQRDPLADAYLMVQDDVIFCRKLRQFLEATLWPSESLAVVSLYYPLPIDDSLSNSSYRPIATKEGLPGALALLFPNVAVRMLLTDRLVMLHRRRGPSQALKLIDVVVGEWAGRAQLPAWGFYPSLCQHIGHTSTIWPESENRLTRHASSFVGENLDPMELFAVVGRSIIAGEFASRP